ncbi:hypothetical protein Noda2021_05270 [Candidatus Dependentiae bacterium Noda2021]|nr:hypothetical protein Noda2021_05270 [Candidatus Dependentiae bacterium Noda2021]
MTSFHLLSAFKRALAWNALLFAFYKLANTGLSFVLYNTLSTNEFYFWAMSNAIIYLSLLWLDCGFRKSIARYVPIFLSDTHRYKAMIRNIVIFQGCMLATVVLGCIAFYNYHAYYDEHPVVLYLCFGIFISQGILFIIQLVFHAQFFNKQFNTIIMATTALEMLLIGCWFVAQPVMISLLHVVLWSKLLTTLVALVWASLLLKQLWPPVTHHNQHIDTEPVSFVVHTTAMWATTVLKSLTERNFLVPFFSFSLGMASANIFKLANDAALLFYRVIVKTLGTADTALLSHVQTGYHADINFNKAFVNITKQIMVLSIPILIVVPALSHIQGMMSSYAWLLPFLIITSCYLVESLLIPFERVLEVKQNYRYLIYAYIPYVVGIIVIAAGMMRYEVTLLQSLTAIHVVRIASMACMAVLAHKAYRVPFPLTYVLKRGMIIAGSVYVVSKLIIIAWGKS